MRSIVILLALLLDALYGDPPNRRHPVAWMGKAIGAASTCVPRDGRARPLTAGAFIAGGGAVLCALVGAAIERSARRLPRPAALLIDASVLNVTLSLRGLSAAAERVHVALEADDCSTARRLLAWHLVSRDTSALSASHIAAATIESVAENASDGVIGSMVWYVLGGLPAALAYRFINTADAMLGYRDARHEWLGKAPALLDDGVNLLPARLTALLIIVAAALTDIDGRRIVHTLRVWWRDARLTSSPNAGHPMSAMAGALNVELEKIDHYRLGAGGRLPEPADIAEAVKLVHVAVLLMCALGVLLTMDDRRPSPFVVDYLTIRLAKA